MPGEKKEDLPSQQREEVASCSSQEQSGSEAGLCGSGSQEQAKNNNGSRLMCRGEFEAQPKKRIKDEKNNWLGEGQRWLNKQNTQGVL